jgi:hypothetical protein
MFALGLVETSVRDPCSSSPIVVEITEPDDNLYVCFISTVTHHNTTRVSRERTNLILMAIAQTNRSKSEKTSSTTQ